jgi:hypothetical protein
VPGLRAAQVGHALIEWTAQCGRPPENLVLLEVPDEETLRRYLGAFMAVSDFVVPFYEPDLDDELTSIAVCDDIAPQILSSLPLLMKGVSN